MSGTAAGGGAIEPDKVRLLETRREIERGWQGVLEQLQAQREERLAQSVARFVERMPPPRTEREAWAEQLHERVHRERARQTVRTR
jgi:hypothetical protein